MKNTKQTSCISNISEKTQETQTPDFVNAYAALLESIAGLCAELDDLERIGQAILTEKRSKHNNI